MYYTFMILTCLLNKFFSEKTSRRNMQPLQRTCNVVGTCALLCLLLGAMQSRADRPGPGMSSLELSIPYTLGSVRCMCVSMNFRKYIYCCCFLLFFYFYFLISSSLNGQLSNLRYLCCHVTIVSVRQNQQHLCTVTKVDSRNERYIGESLHI